MIYEWKLPGVFAVDAQTAGEHLESLRVRRNGHLTAKAVVDDARAPDSPLHPAFEWNDAKAAERWRETRAGEMLRAVVEVVRRPDKPEEQRVRAFVSVAVEQKPVFTSTAVALLDRDMRLQVLTQAWRELQALKKRYSELSEFAHIFAAIDDLPDPMLSIE